MNWRATKVRLNPGHLALLTLIAAWLIWYAYDAWSASARMNNLLLIAPAALVGLGLVAAIVGMEIRAGLGTRLAAAEDGEAGEGSEDDLRTSVTLMLLLAGYVGTMSWIGPDVSTFLFVGLSLFALDERRIGVLLGFSAAFTVIVVAAMGQLVSLPETIFLEALLP